MKKTEKKKNVVQDVIPPKRSIRDVEMPSLRRHSEENSISQPIIKKSNLAQKIETLKPDQIEIKKIPLSSTDLYKYEYKEPSKSRRKKIYLYTSIIIFIIVAGFGISALFKRADIKVTPKQDVKTFSQIFTAKKNAAGNDLAFQIVTINKDVDKLVAATGQEQVEKKARGKIVIYNNYSTESQKLVATTRFQTPEGLIFRLISGATVPGIKVPGVAGSVEVTVEADAPGVKYNIGLKDFTIPGFKGDPKYTKIYARSKTVIAGGYSGMQKIVSKETKDKVNAELAISLKSGLAKDIALQIPKDFVLYETDLIYDLEPVVQVNETAQTENMVTLRKNGSASAVIFNRSLLVKAIFEKISPNNSNNSVNIDNLESLNFTYDTKTPFDLNNSTTVNFTLSGEAHFTWIIDENKLKSDLLGLSKKNANMIISTNSAIKEAWIETYPFWNQNIPNNGDEVTLTNTLTK